MRNIKVISDEMGFFADIEGIDVCIPIVNEVYEFVKDCEITKFGLEWHPDSIELVAVTDNFAYYENDLSFCTSGLIALFQDIPKIIYYV